MTARVCRTPDEGFDFEVPILIIGAGACGLVAALSAVEAGGDALVVEADSIPSGSTALSAGLIPAAGTYFQRDAGIEDDPRGFASDIQRKADGENPQDLVDALAFGSAEVVEWLADRHALPFSLVEDFDYPGHSRRRMHGLPSRTGRELIDHLRSRCEQAGIEILCNRRAETVFHEAARVSGAEFQGPAGTERLGCQALILACNGFGGNRQMVQRFTPKIADALWFGHDGNQGDAIAWGEALGAACLNLGAYQGHGNVAHPHGILITWAVIAEGGIQVNLSGERFWNEAQGYSEAARAVLAQPDGLAWSIFDERIAKIARQFQDFTEAENAGALRVAQTVEDLALNCDLPPKALADTVLCRPVSGPDRFGRTFDRPPLAPPYCAVKVTGALFHTQGGLDIAPDARVRRADGSGCFENLFAAGGAAVGVSGTADRGYLSGNGLLSAIVLGRNAGQAAVSLTSNTATLSGAVPVI